MKIYITLCLACALVAVVESQDMTSMLFQAMGLDPPPAMPMMPQSLSNPFYERQQQHHQLLLQRQQQQQKLIQQQQNIIQQQQKQQRYLNYLLAQQRQIKANPYSISGTPGSRPQPLANSVYSSANRIHVPSSSNAVESSKGNPYSIAAQSAPYTPVQATPYTKVVNIAKPANPYSTSRAAGSRIPSVRNRAALAAALRPMSLPPAARNILKTMQTMKTLKAVREQPMRITDAQSIGCRMPSEGPMASMVMYSDCRNPAARMVCEAEMMTCVNVGVSGICCPFGVNSQALDTVGYMNKLQTFVSELV